jgi:FkbH-like protein
MWTHWQSSAPRAPSFPLEHSVNDIDSIRDAVSGFSFNDYLRHLKAVEEATTGGTPLRVAVLRSYTLEPIEPVLRLRLLLEGYRPSLWFGGFNQYAQEILDPQSTLYAGGPDLVLMMVRIEEVMPDFVDDFPARSGSEWEQQVARKAHELARLAGQVAAASSAQVIVQNMTLSRAGYFGVFDAQHAGSQAQLVSAFNRALAIAIGDTRGVFIWDFDAFARAKGIDTLHDSKMWYVSRNPYKQSAYPAIADDLLRYVRAALGRVKKCVVVDLDNTLWGGLAGEDGLDGVEIGHTYPGNCYRDVQKELLKLYHRGILLAINSKNNEDDALRILDEHPEMVLRRRHFAAVRINWQDKAANLRAIARELNIGLESLVFIDDNPAECALVRQECPECDVVILPDKPYLMPAAVAAIRGIENIHITEEDRRKSDMYRAEAARREHEDDYSNLDEFLRSLEMEVSIDPATSFSVPRIAQLTQKTNQMNMTTRRYTEAQISAFAKDPARAVLSVSARDRFGDHGIIGVMILEFRPAGCVIDTFLLSCRVIGRGIEQAMIAFAAEIGRARGASRVIGEFLQTAKNAPATGVYERCGFTPSGDTQFEYVFGERDMPYPPHVRLHATSPNAAG